MNEREAAYAASSFVGHVLQEARRPLSSSEIVERLEKLPSIKPEVRVSLGLDKTAALRARYLNRHLMKLKSENLVRMDGSSPRNSKWAFILPAQPKGIEAPVEIRRSLDSAVHTDAIDSEDHLTGEPAGRQPPYSGQEISRVKCIAQHMGYNLGNAMMHIWHAHLSANAIGDLEKAGRNLDDEIARRARMPLPPASTP